MDALAARYGELAYLLLIVDFQHRATGPVGVASRPHLRVHFFDGGPAVTHDDDSDVARYCEPVRLALEWMCGHPPQGAAAQELATVAEVAALAEFTDWGLEGPPGQNAFDPTPHTGVATGIIHVGAPTALPTAGVPADALEEDATVVLSLGPAGGKLRRSLQQAVPGAPSSPFDEVRSNLEGLLRMLSCSSNGLRSSPTQEQDWRLIARLEALDRHGRGGDLLFVRVAETTVELLRTGELLELLQQRFGAAACLLLIADFQVGRVGPIVVDGVDNLLVYFLGPEVHAEGGDAPYCHPVARALEWLGGACLSDGAEVATFAELSRLAVTHGGVNDAAGVTILGS